MCPDDKLTRLISLDDLNSMLWSDKCDYINPSDCANLNPHNYNFVVIQHNVCSLLCNLTELKRLIQTLHEKNSSVDILLLCQTFLTAKTIRLAKIPGYTLVSKHHRQNHKGGGTAILIKDGIPHKGC